MTPVTMAELMAALPDILAAPKTDAPIASLCLRPGRGERVAPAAHWRPRLAAGQAGPA